MSSENKPEKSSEIHPRPDSKPGFGLLLKYFSNNSAAPTHKGYIITQDGTVIGLCGWEKETKNGHKYFSIAVDRFFRYDPETAHKPKGPVEVADKFGLESDIPW